MTDASRPRVLHVIQTLGAGGAERLVFELVSRLPSHGIDAKALVMCEGGPLEALFREHQVPLMPIVRRPPFGYSTLRDLIKIFRSERPDIVHTHLFSPDTMGRIAGSFAHVPHLVTTEHNVNLSYGITKRLVNRTLSLVTDLHIAVSHEVQRVMMEREGIASKKIRVIPNGIDLDAVIPRSAGPFHDIPRLITVGRLWAQKDQATLLKALALVKRPWRLTVVGTGPLEIALKAMAERLSISSRIQWLGFREDVSQLLASSDVFCFPSRYEGVGLAALEAAAAGVPIIASDLAPLHEVFAYDDIRFVPAGDVPAWARAINATLENPVPSVLSAGRLVPRIRANYSIDNMVAQYADAYRSLL